MAHKTFRIYPENKALYFQVIVWDSRREMYDANSDRRPPFKAICRGHELIRDGKKSGLCGVVHFCKRELGSGLISHEFLHAALVWARRVGLGFAEIASDDAGDATPAEERLCYAHSEMVGQFVARCYETGILE
jgi:hypothetical protein